MTMSDSRTQSLLLSLPGILQTRVLPSRHLMYILLPPSLCSTTPKTSLPRGSFVRLISSCSCSARACSSFFLPMPCFKKRGFIRFMVTNQEKQHVDRFPARWQQHIRKNVRTEDV